MCPENIFESEPDINFSLLCLFTILIQIAILRLQGIYGSMFFIPKICRKGYFNYYKTLNEVKLEKEDIENVKI